MVGGHAVPGIRFGRRAAQGLVVRRLIVVPQGAVGDVAHVEFPVLVGALQPFHQALVLLVRVDVQHHLDQVDVLRGKLVFELDDLVEAPLDFVERGQLLDLLHQHGLVVRPVPHGDAAGLGHADPRPVQEVVLVFLLGRPPEGKHFHALRVDALENVAHHAALAGGVHALQHDDDPRRVPVPAARRGVHPLLQVGDLLVVVVELLGGDGLALAVVRQARGGVGVDMRKPPPLPDFQRVRVIEGEVAVLSLVAHGAMLVRFA